MAEPTARPQDRPGRRGGLGPTTLAALAAGTVCAVAGSRAAVTVEAEGQAAAMVTAGTAQGDALSMPVVTSLSLVALAAWGVLLVTRGLVRRGAAALALLASLGVLAAVVTAPGSLRGTVEDALAEVGASGGSALTGWYLGAVAGAVVLVLAGALAVWRAPSWPEMGRRYDAPSGQEPTAPRAPESPLELWKAMDEGHDPTS